MHKTALFFFILVHSGVSHSFNLPISHNHHALIDARAGAIRQSVCGQSLVQQGAEGEPGGRVDVGGHTGHKQKRYELARRKEKVLPGDAGRHRGCVEYGVKRGIATVACLRVTSLSCNRHKVARRFAFEKANAGGELHGQRQSTRDDDLPHVLDLRSVAYQLAGLDALLCPTELGLELDQGVALIASRAGCKHLRTGHVAPGGAGKAAGTYLLARRLIAIDVDNKRRRRAQTSRAGTGAAIGGPHFKLAAGGGSHVLFLFGKTALRGK